MKLYFLFFHSNMMMFLSPSLPLSAESSGVTQEPVSVPPSGSVDLSELLSEIRHLRLQLERSIQTNTALRQRLEEQLLRGPNRSETININYLLSSPGKHRLYMLISRDTQRRICQVASVLLFTFVLDEGGRSPGRDGADLLHHSFQSHNEYTSVHHGKETSSEVTWCLIVGTNPSLD